MRPGRLGVDYGLPQYTNEGQLSGAPTVSGTSGVLWLPLQPATSGNSRLRRVLNNRTHFQPAERGHLLAARMVI